MRPYQPTLDIKETSFNIRNFVSDHMPILWSIIKPLLPWIIGLHILDILITNIFMPNSENEFILGSIIASYFYTCLVITWHRVVIHGPNDFTRMNPFSPKRSELVFIGMGLVISLVIFVISFIAGFIVAINPAIGLLTAIIAIPFIIFISFRISFYFPAKATDNPMSLKQAYDLSAGYFLKFAGTIIRAPVWVMLKAIAYAIIGVLILIGLATGTGAIIGQETLATKLLLNIFGTLYMIPIIAYFLPLLYAYGVTVLSNYYQHALQNRSVNKHDQN